MRRRWQPGVPLYCRHRSHFEQPPAIRHLLRHRPHGQVRVVHQWPLGHQPAPQARPTAHHIRTVGVAGRDIRPVLDQGVQGVVCCRAWPSIRYGRPRTVVQQRERHRAHPHRARRLSPISAARDASRGGLGISEEPVISLRAFDFSGHRYSRGERCRRDVTSNEDSAIRRCLRSGQLSQGTQW